MAEALQSDNLNFEDKKSLFKLCFAFISHFITCHSKKMFLKFVYIFPSLKAILVFKGSETRYLHKVGLHNLNGIHRKQI